MLAAEEHLGRLAERNRAFGPMIADACDRVRMMHDLRASVQIAASGGMLWRARGTLVPITEQWRQALVLTYQGEAADVHPARISGDPYS
jgi:hypothetical protein